MSTQSTGTIAVFGGTGKQGGSVIDSLLDRGAHVRALVRNPGSDRAQALAARGVELAPIDIGDAASLTAALQGVDAFFLMTTPEGHTLADIEGEAPQGIALVDAAVAAAVPHVVFSSVGGADRDSGVPHFESKRRVEEYLEKSGLRATVVRPVAFMENFAFLAPIVENGEIVLRMPLPDHIPLQLVAVRDIGQISASFLLDAAAAPGGAVEIAGDERTGSQMAAAFGEHAGLPARYGSPAPARPRGRRGRADDVPLVRGDARLPGRHRRGPGDRAEHVGPARLAALHRLDGRGALKPAASGR